MQAQKNKLLTHLVRRPGQALTLAVTEPHGLTPRAPLLYTGLPAVTTRAGQQPALGVVRKVGRRPRVIVPVRRPRFLPFRGERQRHLGLLLFIVVGDLRSQQVLGSRTPTE